MVKAASVMSFDRTALPSGDVRPSLRLVSGDRAVHVRPRWLDRLGSIAGLIVVLWSVPVFVVALPLVFAWRAVLQVTRWR